MHSVSRIWWRQHDKYLEEQAVQILGLSEDDVLNGETEEVSDQPQFEGFQLRERLGCQETLHQLMFSVVMLHWSLYSPPTLGQGKEANTRVTLEQWLELNRGLYDASGEGGEVPS